MKKVLSTAAVLSVAATSVLANPKYPVEVTKDGVLYNCAAEVVLVNGVESRRCITVGGSNEAGATGAGGAAASLQPPTGGSAASASASASSGGLTLTGLGVGMDAAQAAMAIAAAFAYSVTKDNETVSTNGTN